MCIPNVEGERLKEIFSLTYLGLFPYGEGSCGKGMGIKTDGGSKFIFLSGNWRTGNR